MSDVRFVRGVGSQLTPLTSRLRDSATLQYDPSMIIRKVLAAGLGCGLLAAMSCGLLPATASADDAGEPAAGPPPKVELVLDVSGSMRATDIDGESRMSAAKQAFDDVLDSTPADVQLGRPGARTPGSSIRSARWTAPRPRPPSPPWRPPAGPRSAPRCWPPPTTSRAATAPSGSS
jgi:Ca-activated chloride channel family protein